MDDRELQELISSARNALRPLLRRSEAARRLTELVGKLLLEEARAASDNEQADAEAIASSGAVTGQGVSAESIDGEVEASPRAIESPSQTSRGIVPLKIGGATVNIEVEGDTASIAEARRAGGAHEPEATEKADIDDTPIDLSLIVNRSRLKAASCRLYIERRKVEYDLDRELPLVDQMNEMLGKAKALTGCFLWVFWPERSQPSDEVLEEIAECYVALAEAADCARLVTELPSSIAASNIEQVFQCLAEASSALRVALCRTWLTSPDADQDESHEWLRHETATRRIFVKRHMRLDDPAEPVAAPVLRSRVAALRDTLEAGAQETRRIEELCKRVAWHAANAESELPEPDDHDIERITDTINSLVSAGIPPTETRFGEIIPVPVAGVLARSEESAVRQVAQAILDRAAAAKSAAPAPAPTAPQWSEQVHEIRRLLCGGRIVMVGGDPRREAKENIVAAFELNELDWVNLTEHGRGDPMKAPIFRPDTKCVLVLIKLCGHQHAEEAGEYAKAAGVPCVFVRAGYNPEQIAHTILEQASERLMAAAGDA